MSFDIRYLTPLGAPTRSRRPAQVSGLPFGELHKSFGAGCVKLGLRNGPILIGIGLIKVDDEWCGIRLWQSVAGRYGLAPNLLALVRRQRRRWAAGSHRVC